MNTYLLLRNNKQTGPHSLAELLALGLKPYDLVWVHGRSAAWRYPGEVEELKPHAPAVEEQPFDRFFKKSSESSQKAQPSKNAEPTPKPAREAEKSSREFVPKKSVFVTMPGKLTAVIPEPKPLQKQQAPQQEIKKQEPIPEQSSQITGYEKYLPPVSEHESPAPTIIIKENPVAAEIKYEQSLDDIKAMYVKTLQQRKKKTLTKAFLIGALKKAAVVIVIVGAGVFIGFNIQSGGKKKQEVLSTMVPQTLPSYEMDTTQPAPSPDEINELKEKIRQDQLFSKEESSREKLIAPVISENYAEPEKERLAPEDLTLKVHPRKEIKMEGPAPGVEVNGQTGERTRRLRNENDANATPALSAKTTTDNLSAKGLSKFVSVKSNEYKRVAFGGIRDLQLTVSNDSKYVLDNVTVEIQYLKPSEEPLKTENIQFRAISPGSSMTIRVPDTNRGIKVLYKITHILSTEGSRDTADL